MAAETGHAPGTTAAPATERPTDLRLARQTRRIALGQSSAMAELTRMIDKVAPTKARVLIHGPTGSGKELIARAIHRQRGSSKRCPFVKVNCAAIPDSLIESELFGHERGAFTGADVRRHGLFERAHGGTLFLDEVADMSSAAQAKVLRVLQTGELTRVGGEKPIQVDVRVVAATNQDLAELVCLGRFREDLYFRLNVVCLHAPALTERKADIPLLVETFARECAVENRLPHKPIGGDVLRRLAGYPWPGNIRELKNVVQHMVIMSDEVVTVGDLPPDVRGHGRCLDELEEKALSLREYTRRAEKQLIQQTLEDTGWNISKTARKLDTNRTDLHRRIKAYGLVREVSE